MKTKVFSVVICSSLALGGCVFSTQQNSEIAADDNVTIAGFVASKRHPIQVSCRNPTDLVLVPLATVMPSRTPTLVDRHRNKAFNFSVTVTVPPECKESDFFYLTDWYKSYTTFEVGQVLADPDGQKYVSSQNIYFAKAGDMECASRAFERTHSFAQAFLDGCYAGAERGTRDTALFVHGAPINSAAKETQQ